MQIQKIGDFRKSVDRSTCYFHDDQMGKKYELRPAQDDSCDKSVHPRVGALWYLYAYFT